MDGANRHDKTLVKRTLDTIIFEIPPTNEIIQNMCMDKGYDFPDVRKIVEEYGYTAHTKSRGEENIREEISGFKVRRWVVEKTHSWLNRFRRLLIRWENRELLCYASFCICKDNIQSSGTFWIGSEWICSPLHSLSAISVLLSCIYLHF